MTAAQTVADHLSVALAVAPTLSYHLWQASNQLIKPPAEKPVS